MKIIHILHHSQLDYQNDIRFYEEDWHARVAIETLKRTKDYAIECWRPEKRINRTISGTWGDIPYKIFPSYQQEFGYEYSRALIRELWKEARRNDILIHIHGIHYAFSWLISSRFKDCPVVGQQHGGLPSLAQYKISTHPFRFLYRLQSILEERSLKHVDHFFVLTEFEKNALLEISNRQNVEVQTMGVDFDFFTPSGHTDARNNLKVPPDSKICMYAGRFDRSKGMDLLLDAFQSLKKRFDVELLLVGGLKTHELYTHAKSCGAHLIERIPSQELVPYYSAADVYCLNLPNNDAGGIGIAPVEALACNTPVVGNTLIHFPTPERAFLGEIPDKESDFTTCIARVLEDPNRYQNCREIASRVYNWDTIIGHTKTVYDELFEEYA